MNFEKEKLKERKRKVIRQTIGRKDTVRKRQLEKVTDRKIGIRDTDRKKIEKQRGCD